MSKEITTEPLASAASLLRVGVSAFGESSLWGDTSLDDILEVILIAKGRVREWLNQIGTKEDGTHAYNAMDMLILAKAVIVSRLDIASEKTISPLRCALKMALESLEQAVEANQPDSADAAQEAA